MEKMNKLSMLLAVALVFVAGCGKKKDKHKNKHLASAEIPTLSNETEALFDDNVSSLAFVDDEFDVDVNRSKKFAGNNIEVDRSEIAEQDAERSANYAFKTVHFSFNKNDIRPDQRNVVAQDVQLAKAAVAEGREVVVEGHTCQMGSAAYNLALSQRRAESLKHEMVANGVAADAVKTIGMGYECPLVSSNAHARAAMIKELAPNRRAEVLVS